MLQYLVVFSLEVEHNFVKIAPRIMVVEGSHSQQEIRPRQRLRGLRPLLWWLLFVLTLFLYRTHERLSAQTHLSFALSLSSRPVLYEASVLVGGKPFASGSRIPIGWHRLVVSHPKTDPFSTNLFIWYGAHDLGELSLKRRFGSLVIESRPRARLLSIRGPEFWLTLTNTGGVTSSVPTDAYQIEAHYAHFQQRDQTSVIADSTNHHLVVPRMGTLDLSCTNSEAKFRLLNSRGDSIEEGTFPTIITELGEGSYILVAVHNGNRQEKKLSISSGATKATRVEFLYGAAELQTDPPGARVLSAEGRELGTTPIGWLELVPGRWDFNLHKDGYEPATVSILVRVGETNTFRTNLVSQAYAQAMRSAGQFMDTGDYDRAAEVFSEASRVQADDPAAIALQHKAVALGDIARAEKLGKQRDYIAGIKELEKALATMPDNTQAKEMLSDFKQHEPEQLAQQEQERVEALKNFFDSFTGKVTGANLVETHELRTPKRVNEVEAAIAAQFQSVTPSLKLSHVGWTTNTQIFHMDADQEIPGGGRICMIVGAQTRRDETRIRFKVVEFKGEPIGIKVLGAVLGAVTSTRYQSTYQPINASDPYLTESDKNRVAEGVRLMTETIQRAIGEAAIGQTSGAR